MRNVKGPVREGEPACSACLHALTACLGRLSVAQRGQRARRRTGSRAGQQLAELARGQCERQGRFARRAAGWLGNSGASCRKRLLRLEGVLVIGMGSAAEEGWLAGGKRQAASRWQRDCGQRSQRSSWGGGYCSRRQHAQPASRLRAALALTGGHWQEAARTACGLDASLQLAAVAAVHSSIRQTARALCKHRLQPPRQLQPPRCPAFPQGFVCCLSARPRGAQEG